MPILPFALFYLGSAILSDLLQSRPEGGYGYGESVLARVPVRVLNEGSWGLRGRPRSWRHPIYGAYVPAGDVDLGVRAPTASWRHPLPRRWEEFQSEVDEFGVLTGTGGIRGVPTFQAFTPAQQAAMRRDEAAQGLRGTSVAPPGF